ncbi:MAG: GNAT family N-acetyltransferase [Alphaproteobacteria bacterium]|nr:GNAT family N-acetyltransferase [Alphaproteobacteria bacterium]MBU1512771.1 GNAT family N-acetyltransferase [Alphaproteobacteria bacterium]MBU2096556.1 GNAT family N-acetyltransferase [Alphaproteobacteria bacterium]MBU2151924.1 GNAT family N-acetyltransferase [Alphaproteobacteria bacterium]MBU2306434.1 GNAT family N-acetyltransferase [Alphaproteobacteria bacterium]
MGDITIRWARGDEAAALSALALRAKASWGYDAAFMEACRAELTLTPEQMARWTIWVAEADGAIAGMIALNLTDGAVVEDFFVEPDVQGRGVGATLMATLLAACREAGVTTLEVDADPNAEGIYARLGFVTFARSPSGSIPGRTLPRMRLALA